MQRPIIVIAVAALAATAISFPAHAYCRGCVIESASARTARAEAPPSRLERAACYVEVDRRHAHKRRAELCR